MKIIDDYLKQKNQKFYCKDNSGKMELEVNLINKIGKPSSSKELDKLKKIAKDESKSLIDIYKKYNGLQLQINGETIGLIISAIDDLENDNNDWHESFEYLEEDELYDFQKNGFAFGQIYQSGNYFIIYNGKIYYSDHDGGDDSTWGNSLEEFFKIALSDPAKFLYDVGCYTRYFDGKTDTQYIPEKYIFEN